MSEWDRCAPMLERTLRERHPEWTLDEVRAEVEAGRALFWPGRDAVMITDMPRDLRMWLVGGDLRELLRMEESVRAFAGNAGFDRLTFENPRSGWERLMVGRRGYGAHTIVSRETG